MRVVVADDHPLYREAAVLQIQRLFSQVAIDQVASLDELRALAEQGGGAFDLFLVDFHMPGMSVEALENLVRQFKDIPVAVISGTAQRADVRAMLRAGARGFIPKTATGEHMAHALQLLMAGGTSVPAEMLLEDALTGWQAALSGREKEVLRGVVRGLSNKEIGRELNLAEVTIKLHLRGIFRKMSAKSRADAAVIATRAGFV